MPLNSVKAVFLIQRPGYVKAGPEELLFFAFFMPEIHSSLKQGFFCRRRPYAARQPRSAAYWALPQRSLLYMQKNMRTKAPFILVFCLLLAGCAAEPGNIPPEPSAVEYTPDDLAKPLETKCRTDHQGFHEVTRSKAYMNKDESLSVVFHPEPPAYWLGMELLIKDGFFRAIPYGAPFSREKVGFEVTRQELILRDSPVMPGVTVNGCASVNFIQKNPDATVSPHFFTGCFSARVYPAGGSLFPAEGLKLLAEQELAVICYELGAPIHDELFMAGKAGDFRAAILGPGISRRTEVRELTWNTSPTAGLGDEGRDRLSVWYTRQGDQWFPIASRIWQSGAPPGQDGREN